MFSKHLLRVLFILSKNQRSHFLCRLILFFSHRVLEQLAAQRPSLDIVNTLQTHKTVPVHFISVCTQIYTQTRVCSLVRTNKLQRTTCRISLWVCMGSETLLVAARSRFRDVNFAAATPVGGCGDDVLRGGLLTGWLLLLLLLQVFGVGLGCTLRSGLF